MQAKQNHRHIYRPKIDKSKWKNNEVGRIYIKLLTQGVVVIEGERLRPTDREV